MLRADAAAPGVAAEWSAPAAQGAQAQEDEAQTANDAGRHHDATVCAVLDWHALWTAPRTEPKWLCEPLLEEGRVIALYSPAKTGKSLLVLEIAAGLAAGRPVLGNVAREPVSVLSVVDMENSHDDIRERLHDMGYEPADLVNLHYLSFPDLPYLDTEAGGDALLKYAQSCGATLVILDTISRFFRGEENSNDTFRSVYRNTIMPLKRAGVTVLRLDHTGKNEEAGQRGASAKVDDVDAVWLLERTKNQGHFKLSRTHSRTNHGEDNLEIERVAGPLRHVVSEAPVRATVTTPEGLSDLDLIRVLDEHGLPLEAGRDKIKEFLEGQGHLVSKSRAAEIASLRKSGPAAVAGASAGDQGDSPGSSLGQETEGLPACPSPMESGGQGAAGQVMLSAATSCLPARLLRSRAGRAAGQVMLSAATAACPPASYGVGRAGQPGRSC